MAYIEKRKSKTGGVSYRVQVRLKGHPTETATFERKTDAKKWAQNIESAIREGRHFKTTESKKHTLGDLVERYIRDVMPMKSKVMEKQLVQLRWWNNKIGDHSLANVTPALISEHRDLLLREEIAGKKKRSSSTANRYLAAISHAFTIAAGEWGWVNENPVKKVARFKEPKGVVRFLDDDERRRLISTCKESNNPFLLPVVLIALSTGARKMEILKLRWPDVDLVNERAILHDTKNGETRPISIQYAALDELKKLSKVRRLDTDLIFPGNNPQSPIELRKHWVEALQKAEIKNFRFHDLRHTAASYLAMSGASTAEIAEILGHKTLQMVKRYSHLSEQHTASVVSKMNEKFLGDI